MHRFARHEAEVPSVTEDHFMARTIVGDRPTLLTKCSVCLEQGRNSPGFVVHERNVRQLGLRQIGRLLAQELSDCFYRHAALSLMNATGMNKLANIT